MLKGKYFQLKNIMSDGLLFNIAHMILGSVGALGAPHTGVAEAMGKPCLLQISVKVLCGTKR